MSILVILLVTFVAYFHGRDSMNCWSLGIYLTLATLFQQGTINPLPVRFLNNSSIECEWISGWSDLPRGTSGRLLVFVFMVFSMLLYNFYNASVVSSLLSDPTDTIHTIADLLHTGMPAAYENASYVPHYFAVCIYRCDTCAFCHLIVGSWFFGSILALQISTIPEAHTFYEKRLLDQGKPKVLPRSEGIRRVKAGGFAYHTTPGDSYEEIARDFKQPEICKLAEVGFIKKTILAMWGWRGNPYREHLRIM